MLDPQLAPNPILIVVVVTMRLAALRIREDSLVRF